ncbi:Nucleic-acid-binding protein from transposon X-element, partial [Stegodyphus mimosarum]
MVDTRVRVAHLMADSNESGAVTVDLRITLSSRSVVADLINNSIEHYVITPKHKRPIKVVIRGLPIIIDKSETMQELTNLDYSVFKVVQLTRFRTKQLMPLFQAQLNHTENIENIYNETHLGLFIVSIEKYANESIVPQCHNCQLFHHSSDTCFFLSRCVKCAQQPKTSDCPPEDFIENPVCANCHKNHPAPYRGCEKFPKIKPKSGPNKISATAIHQPTVSPAPSTTQGKSYAQAAS